MAPLQSGEKTIGRVIGLAIAFREAFTKPEFTDEDIRRIGLGLCEAVDDYLAYMKELGIAPAERWACPTCGALYLEQPAACSTCAHRAG